MSPLHAHRSGTSRCIGSPEVIQRLQSAASGTISQAMRRWIHHWFGPDRVVVVDGDEPAFKAAFRSPLQAEWTEGVLAREVGRVNAHLGETGHAGHRSSLAGMGVRAFKCCPCSVMP
mgnify:CR=1 FL=1